MNIIKKLISDLELNIDNPVLRSEVIKDIKTWIDRHSVMFNHAKFTTSEHQKLQEWYSFYTKLMDKEYKL